MSFGERMKELLGQGLSASKELAVKAGERAQDIGEKSFQASKELFNKAGAKAQDLGEKGVLMLEIRQLEGQAGKLISRLGSEVYSLLAEQRLESVSSDTPEVKTVLGEIALIREALEKRETELKNRK